MSRRIILWDTRNHSTQDSDDAGTTILKSVLPPPIPSPGPYESNNVDDLPYTHVPSLACFALKKLIEYPDQVHALGHIRLRYQAPSSQTTYDILRALIPSYDPDADLTHVDPRLWATLIQIFSDLPDTFRTYRLPLSDKHVPILQRIPSSPHFSLITILDLPECKELTDETVIELKHLSGLCVLDASSTLLSGHGIKSLSRTLMWTEDESATERERRGPWRLRILCLRNCVNVDNDIFSCLDKFLLLSVVDLRGTRCNLRGANQTTFRPSKNKSFFYPSPLSITLDLLSSASPKDSPLFSSADPYILHITSLHHKSASHQSHSSSLARSQAPKPSVNMQDTYVVLPPSHSFTTTEVKKEPHTGSPDSRSRFRRGPASTRIKVGNSETLARNREAREEMERHERNKEAWYERNAHLADRGAGDWMGGGCGCCDDDDDGMGLDTSDELCEDDDDDDDDSDIMSEDDDSEEEDSDGMDIDLFTSGGHTSAPTSPSNSDPPPLHDSSHSIASNTSPKTETPAPPPQTPTRASPASRIHPSVKRERRRISDVINEASSILSTRNTDPRRATTGILPPRAAIPDSLLKTPAPVRRRLLSAGRNQTSDTGHVVLPSPNNSHGDSEPGRPRPASGTSLKQPLIVTPSIAQRARIQGPTGLFPGHAQGVPPPSNNPYANPDPGRKRPASRLNSERLSTDTPSTARLTRPRNTSSSLSRILSALPSSPIVPPTIVQPSRAEVDIQRAVAQEEADIHASRSAAATFYLPMHPQAVPVITSHRRQRLSESLYQDWGQDELLMLFREPPPWSVLEGSRDAAFAARKNSVKEKLKGRAEEVSAVLDRSNTKGADGMKELMEMVKRRKLTKPAIAVASNRPGVVTMPRNPFRRKVQTPEDSGGASIQESNGGEGSTRPPLSTMLTTQKSMVDGNSIRPLKPISTLKVPLLPEEMRRGDPKNVVVSVEPSECRGPSLDGSNRTSKTWVDTSNASSSKNSARKSTSSNLGSRVTHQGPVVKMLQSSASKSVQKAASGTRIPIKASDNIRPKSKSTRTGGNIKGTATFDWKGWGSK